MRKNGFLAVVIAVLSVGMLPALAKVEVKATTASITGPGTDIHLTEDQAGSLAQRADLDARVYGDSSVDDAEPDGQLGPRFQITYELVLVDHAKPSKTTEATIVQYLFPLADEGPYLQTPSGQSIDIASVPGHDGEIHGGWMQVDQVTMDHLEVYGVPSSPAALAGNLTESHGDGGGGGWLVPVATGAVIAALGLTALLVTRGRRSAIASP
jgi:hypothetical protein